MSQLEYLPHSIAEIVPPMREDEYLAFRDDIRANGLVVPIMLFEGKILDGRHRYRACMDTNQPLSFREFQGDWFEAVAYVESMNLRRRDLSESQKAMCAAELANLKRGRPSLNPSAEGYISQSVAAKMVGVSLPSVERASKVLRDGDPELIEAVKQGEVSVSAGAQLATLPKPEQRRRLQKGRSDKLSSYAINVKAASSLRKAKSTHDCCLKCNDELEATDDNFVADAQATRAAFIRKGRKDLARLVDSMLEEHGETAVLAEYHDLEVAVFDLVSECPQSDYGLKSRFGVSKDEIDVVVSKLRDGGWIERKRSGVKKDNARGSTEALWYPTDKAIKDDYHFRVQERVPVTELELTH
jgi:ParB-like chromosome segregation protein Spo0J